jgi:hypothetical protein
VSTAVKCISTVSFFCSGTGYGQVSVAPPGAI